ncbi:MAG: NAD(P)H-dependent oxidoreductase [Dehalococcoidia bacterium]
MRAVAISGSPTSPSKSKALAELALAALANDGFETQLIDLATLPAEPLLVRGSDAAIDNAISAVGEASVLVAATPTYRALYTGLLKCFFDLMPQRHLAGKACVGLQTAAAPEHALAVEYGLPLLFRSLDGTPMPGVFATDEEFEEGRPGSELVARVEAAARSAGRVARASS